MKKLYRDHKGSLSESMQTVRQINSIEELKKYLNSQYSEFNRYIEEIKIEYACHDRRVKWSTYYVLIRLNGDDNFFITGMCNNNLNQEAPCQADQKNDSKEQ